MNDHATFSLTDDAGSEQMVKCRYDGSALQVRADAYGGGDDLVRLEHRDGRLVLLVWADVNDDQPTLVIDLESARQQHRNEVITEAKKYLRNETQTPLQEAGIFLRVYQCINWRTGKQFTMREAADVLDVEYARFRNHLMLVMPVVPASLSDEDRERLLQAPATPSVLKLPRLGERK